MRLPRPGRETQRKLMVPIIFLFWISLYTYTYILSAHSKAMGASLSMVGMITGMFGLMQLFLRMPFGILSDYLANRKFFSYLGLGCFCLAGFGMFMATTPWMLLLFSAVSGVGASTWAVYIGGYCSYFPPEKAGQVTGTLNVMMGAGQLLGTVNGGVFAQLLGRRQVFLVAMVPAMIGIVLLLLVDETHSGAKQAMGARDFVGVVRDKQLLFYSCLAAVLYFMTYAAINSFVPVLMTNLGGSSLQISIGSALSLLALTITSTMSCTVFQQKLGIRLTSVLGFSLMMGAVLLFARVGSIHWIYVLQFVFGLGRGAIFPLFNACATCHLPPQLRATGNATFQAIYALGMFAGPALSGALSDLFSIPVTFVILGGICGAVILFVGFTGQIPARKPEPRKAEPVG